MKFGKLMQSRAEELSSCGLGEHFLRYKALKKQLKQIQKSEPATDDKDIEHAFQSLEHASSTLETGTEPAYSQQQSVIEGLTPGELSFIETLKEDLQQFNEFFIEKEEECIIRTQALEEQLLKADKSDVALLGRLRSAFVDLHGEMVLLLHWSLLNYAGVVKILKKHDKQSGVVLRAPFLETVLQQPFYSTDKITGLVKDVEQHLSAFLLEEQEAERITDSETASPSGKSRSVGEMGLLKRTQAALDMWREMGNKASTPSTVVRTKVAKKGNDDRPSTLSKAPEESLSDTSPVTAVAAVVVAK